MIVSFIQTKGGTAKTTLARCLAYSEMMSQHFSSIALLELDTQGTLKRWYQQRKEWKTEKESVEVIALSTEEKEGFRQQISTIGRTYPLLILDVPGESTGKFSTQFAMALSDFVFIPMRTSDNDEQSFHDHIAPLIQKFLSEKHKTDNQFYVIPTFVHPQANQKKIQHYLSGVLPDGVSCCSHSLPNRSIYENFSRDGRTLVDYQNLVRTHQRESAQIRKAIGDIENIAQEILHISGMI